MSDIYTRLAAKLDELPQGFPTTQSGVELRILEKLYTREEAEIVLRMRLIPETVEAIAERLGEPLERMQEMLENMGKKGLIGGQKMAGLLMYKLIPFMVGIYEAQRYRMDKELADLVEEYEATILKTIGKFEPAVFRVVPIGEKIKTELLIHRYEDACQMVREAKAVYEKACVCRKQKHLAGHSCKRTSPSKENCITISYDEEEISGPARAVIGKKLSKEEAIKMLRDAEEEGLVHNSYNIQTGQVVLCNCCPCCCALFRGLKQFKAPYMLAKSSFVASIDEETCTACGMCTDNRCPMDAIEEGEDSYRVLTERCIGCGLCSTVCPTESITLVRKSETEEDRPPSDMMEWLSKRAASRGVEIK